MKIHRFIGDFEIKTGDLKINDQELLNQFRNVLKLRVGEIIILCDGKMNEGEAEIKGYGKDSVEVEIKEVGTNKNELERHVVLYCSILKRENFELVVQKATEIGVKEIVPLITARTIKLDIRKDRLEKIIKEAAEQSGRGIVPVLHDPIDFEKVLEFSDLNKENFFFDQSGIQFEHFKQSQHIERLGIWIGPEGGWTPQELELANNSGFRIINLGKLTLRAETAAIVGSYISTI